MARKSMKAPTVKGTTEDDAIVRSSGNVFADLGFDEPEEEMTKAQLTREIHDVIKRQRLTQAAAAALMGIDQPKVSALLNGRLHNFSSGRLMRLLTALGQDVDIVIRAKARGRRFGAIRVSQVAVEHDDASAPAAARQLRSRGSKASMVRPSTKRAAKRTIA